MSATLPAPRETAPPKPEVRDAGSLRMGGLPPLLAPAEVADPGLLRMGGLSPIFARD